MSDSIAAQLFMRGYARLHLDPAVLEQAKPYVATEVFETTTNDGTYTSLWEYDPSLNKMAPPHYEPLVREVVAKATALVGVPLKCAEVVMWRGCEMLPFHDHVDDGELHDYHVLVYMGTTPRTELDGGLLLLRNALMPDDIDAVVPNFGIAILLNNTNSLFQHAVTACMRPHERIAFQVDLAYDLPS